MPLNIRSEVVNQRAERLAARKRTNKAEIADKAMRDKRLSDKSGNRAPTRLYSTE